MKSFKKIAHGGCFNVSRTPRFISKRLPCAIKCKIVKRTQLNTEA